MYHFCFYIETLNNFTHVQKVNDIFCKYPSVIVCFASSYPFASAQRVKFKPYALISFLRNSNLDNYICYEYLTSNTILSWC